MAGLPPLFGFVAKESLLESFFGAAEHGQLAGWVALGAAAIAGAFFVAYSLTFLWDAFLRPVAKEGPARLTGDARKQRSPTPVLHAPSGPFVAAPLFLVACGTAMPFLLGPLSGLFTLAAAPAPWQTMDKHVSLWHGFTPALFTSLLAIAVGIVLFLNRNLLRRMLLSVPRRMRGVLLFQQALDGIYTLAQITARLSQGYTLATQSAIVLLAAFVPVAAALRHIRLNDLMPQTSVVAGSSETILILMTIVSAYVTVRVRTRLGAIISLGVVGVSVTLFYVFFSAPDLALTQLLIEVLTVVLLVLVFTKLPPDTRPPMQRIKQVRNLLVALAAGAFGFFLVLFNSSVVLQAGLKKGNYFLQNAVPGGHGANVVNVILVDFRAFDTMGEITVLAIAALGGYALLNAPRVRLPGRSEQAQDTLRRQEGRQGALEEES